MSALLPRGQRGAEGTSALPSNQRPLIVSISVIVALAFVLSMTAAFTRPATQSFADLAAKVKPAVVNIMVEARSTRSLASSRGTPGNMPFGQVPKDSPFYEFFKRFGDRAPGFQGRPTPNTPNNPRRFSRGVGSGFIIDPSGYVVTNDHVVRRATKITVKLHNGETYTARKIGRDQKTDLALLKIDAKKKLPFVKFGESDKIRVGDWILAVGNPFGLGGTVTAGIVSARGRNIQSNTIVDFIQIDASINRGNSGGPAFNTEGEVVGVNTAIYSPSGGSVGLGFAIPSNTVKKVVAELRANGKVSRGWLGVRIQAVNSALAEGFGLDKPRGALIASIEPNSPAARAGLRSGDVITAWDGKPVQKLADLPRLVANTVAGKAVKVSVWRDRAEKTMSVTVGALPQQKAELDNAKPSGKAAPAGAQVALKESGMTVADLNDRNRSRYNVAKGTKGAIVTSVKSDGAAARQGIRSGDVINSVSLKPVETAKDVAKQVADAKKEGRKTVTLQLTRQGMKRFVALRVAQA